MAPKLGWLIAEIVTEQDEIVGFILGWYTCYVWTKIMILLDSQI